MLISTHLRTIAKTRSEIVFSQGSPLKQQYTSLACENCETLCDEAIVTSIGFSWRSGWLLLCKKCYHTLNIWEETHEEQSKSIERNLVRVCVQ